MTDPTPDPTDRELELTAHRDELIARMQENIRDLAALVITRPQLRTPTISALAAEELGDLLGCVLGWVDELLLPREADEIRTQLEHRAAVALAVTPAGLAELE